MRARYYSWMASLATASLLILTLIFLPYLLSAFLLVISVLAVLGLIAFFILRHKFKKLLSNLEAQLQDTDSATRANTQSQFDAQNPRAFSDAEGPIISVDVVEIKHDNQPRA